ncbi:MAG TPA: bifunctional DNA-binding transcriptional regulator/O6-methylguanine-DNA methyltransferase Ada [Xanthobacteraceae bacterium]|nr:bifunctional DNA-binding transcriptional regulator/O6-methylguanine-DNA methyltransferase Ada [Xanthobacteraceae bacterium]
MLSLTNSPSETPARFPTDEARWDAVKRRDRAADGAFFYSVLTTGVYCRPTCAARLARRENVAFHATPADAERAGFRPCKRCRPNERGLAERQASAVAKVCRLIEAAEEMPSLEALAHAAGLSRFHFHRVFKAVTGVTPRAYAQARRGARVREELERSATVTQAIYGAGFNSNGRFYAAVPDLIGMTPTEFRAGGKGNVIRFAVGECSLGAILVAATEKGVCAITFADDPSALVRDLQDRFAQAELIGGDEKFERLVAQVVGFVEAPSQGLDLPIDVRGTAFQQRVWRALRAIPSGSTASYAEIAKRIGQPKSVRAVAQACAANRLAVAIPCHRVVRTDGALSNYRWGVARKRALLDREAAA